MKKFLLHLLLLIMLYNCAHKQKQEETTITNKAWWKEGIVYQIYPRSFKDSDGDGVGDLKGVIQELDYIKSLGVTMVWMNPFFKSPMIDNGYDVSDYKAILPEFGNMEDFEILLNGLHKRDIKFVLDVVVNHSSDQHEWFKQSRSSRTNPYRDYYHWWPAEKGVPPYRYSLFDADGNAWKYDATTNAYYLHYFAAEQPDLNWENPKLRQEVYKIMNFWAEKGVDGFRLDAFQFAAKDTTFPEFPKGFEKDFIQFYAMQTGIHDYLKEMNTEVLSKYDIVSVAEGAGRNFIEAHDLVDEDRNELNMAYAFDGVDLAKPNGYSLLKLKETFSKWDKEFSKKGWLSIFLSNHDQARLVSRFGNDSQEFRSYSTKMLNTFILSMRGTPYCYYGDELGMTNINFDSISQYKDIAAINGYKKALSEGQDMTKYMSDLKFASRDNGRTPMHWDTSKNAGFTTGSPWLPVNKNYKEINVATEDMDSNSILNHFRSMVKLRKENDLLIYGDYKILQAEHPEIYAYTRELNNNKMLVLLNFTDHNSNIELPEIKMINEVLINNYKTFVVKDNTIQLKPYQAILFKLN